MENICFLKSCVNKKCYTFLQEVENTWGFIKEVNMSFCFLIFKNRVFGPAERTGRIKKKKGGL